MPTAYSDHLLLLEIKVTPQQYAEIQRLHGGGIKMRPDNKTPVMVQGDFLEQPTRMEYAEAVAAVTGMPLASLQLANFRLKVKRPKYNPFVIMPDVGGL